MYPEGEFLCIVSKQYARDSPEALNSPVTERVKVRTIRINKHKKIDFF